MMNPFANTDHRKILVDENSQGKRLDRFLADIWPDISRSRLKSLIQEDCLTLDGQTITDPSLRVKQGQAFELKIPEPEAAEPVAQDIPLEILFEDEDLLVLDKPAGLVVHPAAGNYDGTLVNALLAHCGDQLSGIGGVKRPGIVHRLDKETSGVMVVAKSDFAHAHLSRQFEKHSLERAYKAILWGVPNPREGRVEGNIGRSSQNRKKMAIVGSSGKHAITNYKTIRPVGTKSSLVECRLETGRTHQIRVHMCSLGNSVIGDALYGRVPAGVRKSMTTAQKTILEQFPRHALHAYMIGFLHPRTDRMVRFETKLPNEINTLVDMLNSI